MMKRFFIELAYNGKAYCGWQRQPQQITIQQTIEDALSTILGKIIDVTGCGRTDTGVHASQYFAHFNYDRPFPPQFIRRINKFLPPDIVLYRIFEVHWDAHTRFDAYHRSYEYHIDLRKNPFQIHTVYHYSYPTVPNFVQMQEGASLLMDYKTFFPFCKTNHNAKTLDCELYRSEWQYDEEQQRMVYHISANRFLRGMVRLIVGMCINLGLGKLPIEAVQQALEQQTRLSKSTSAPPQGLFLTEVRYPYIVEGLYQEKRTN